MKTFAFLALWVISLALASCESTPVKVDSGTVSAQTFSFVTPRSSAEPGFADNRQAIHSLVQNAITGNLAYQGISRVPSGGDITVAYMVITGDNVSTVSIRDYFGYSDDSIDLQDRAHAAHTASKNPNRFEAGTLLIDVIDGKTFKLLKRGHASRPILRDLPADTRSERIREVVDEILRDLSIRR